MNLDTLKAAIDRIIPEDRFPSASQLGVLGFFEKIIPEQGLDEYYKTGLRCLDAEALAGHGKAFASLGPSEQDHILSLIQKGTVATAWATAPEAFFRMLAEQTVEGYYSDPGNGGNRDQAAWKMIGFEVTA